MKSKKQPIKKIQEDISYVPITEQQISDIENKVNVLETISNLSEKVSLHTELVTTIANLKKEIDLATENIDKICFDKSYPKKDVLEEVNIDDSIIDIEKRLEKLSDEDVIQKKIEELTRIASIVSRCRETFNDNIIMKVSRVN